MVENKKQTLRYSDKEMEIIKNTFADNQDLLKAIRKVFLQLPLSAVEQALIITLKNQPDLMGILRKAFLPEIDGDAPFHQVVDLWLTVEIKNKEVDEAFREIKARDALIKYLKQSLDSLEDRHSDDGIVLADLTKVGAKTKTEEMIINLIVRNSVIQHTEMTLNMFDVLAGKKNESPEDTLKRLKQDSSK
jgi:hypothetical protein